MVNIADKQKVKTAEAKAEDIRKRELNDIRTVLSNDSGRRLLWRLMERCKAFGSVYAQLPNDTYYNCGQQDIGHFLMSEVTAADPNLLFKMIKDNKKGTRDAT